MSVRIPSDAGRAFDLKFMDEVGEPDLTAPGNVPAVTSSDESIAVARISATGTQVVVLAAGQGKLGTVTITVDYGDSLKDTLEVEIAEPAVASFVIDQASGVPFDLNTPPSGLLPEAPAGGGQDTTSGGQGTDTVSGGGAGTVPGSDTVPGPDTVSGADTASGGAGADTVSGGAGQDTVQPPPESPPAAEPSHG